MARLNIFVSDKNGQTVSKFGKPKDSDKIVFHNDHPTNELVITTESPALCKSKTSPAEQTIHVPGGGTMAYVVCDAFQGDSFKYTATIAGSLPEDPIIIIEKSGFLSPVLINVLVGVGGLVVGLLISKFLARRGMSSPS